MECQFWSDMQVLLPAQWDHICALEERELQVLLSLVQVCSCVWDELCREMSVLWQGRLP